MDDALHADPRVVALRRWLDGLPGAPWQSQTLRPASSDASFRRYFRVDAAADSAPRAAKASPMAQAPAPGAVTAIVMDAPPEHENSLPFVTVAQRFAEAGVHTPTVLAADLAQGFLLLSDLGQHTYADVFATAQARTIDRMVADALATLVRIQRHRRIDALPAYDRGKLMAEMHLFPQWYLGRHLRASLSATEQTLLDRTFTLLADAALAQPQVDVHRDFHCRNLMHMPAEQNNPGVLDFQDAVMGPITYDLVSLLRDAYVDWPPALQLDWAVRYWEQARAAALPVHPDFGAFWRDLEWMGLQRHLKILGIFARLHHRDGKDRYLADLPRVLGYVRDVALRYDAFNPLLRLLDRLAPPADVKTGFSF